MRTLAAPTALPSKHMTLPTCVLQEVTPVLVPGKQGGTPSPVMTDEALLKVKPDKLRNLPPAFVKEGGTVTAGNSSIIADGAAALVLVSAERASELGLRVSPPCP